VSRRTIAVLLGLVVGVLVAPGAGHLYAGRWWRGLVWWTATLAAILAILFSIHFLWLVMAIKCGHAFDLLFLRIDPAPRRWGWIVVGGVLVTGAIGLVLRTHVIVAFKLPSSWMAPTFEPGDRVLVDKTHRGGVQRGEVIVFRHPCAPQRVFIERAVALGGDTVEVRCDVLYVNGAAVPRTLVAAEATYRDVSEEHDAGEPRRASRWREQLGGIAYEVFDPMEGTTPGAGDFPPAPDAMDPGEPELPGCEGSGAAARATRGEIVVREAVGDPCAPQAHYVVPGGDVFVLGDNRARTNDSRSWGSVPGDHVVGRPIGIWWSDSGWARVGDM